MSVLGKLGLGGKGAVGNGAGRGPGRGLALALAGAGCDIVAAARTRSQIDETAGQVSDGGRRCLVVPTDITDPASVAAMVESAIAEFGRIDILLNNAGGATEGMGKPVEEITDREWHTGIDTNLSGTFYCCRAAIPHMLRQGGGKIINVTSGFRLPGGPDNFMYTPSQAGLVDLPR